MGGDMMVCIYYLPCEERKTHDSSDLTLGPMVAAVQRTGAGRGGRGGCCRGGVVAGHCRVLCCMVTVTTAGSWHVHWLGLRTTLPALVSTVLRLS